jgi:hypothetical protein
MRTTPLFVCCCIYCCADNGSEGSNSCIQLSATTMQFSYSMPDPCPAGTHLLTMRSAVPASGLFAFANSLTTSQYWVGGFQSYTASNKNRGWAWVDGTDATNNLNCGTINPDSTGCALWNAGEPSGSTPTETHAADFVRRIGNSGSSRLADNSGANDYNYMCEYEISTQCPPGWVFYKDDGTEGYDSCVYLATSGAQWSSANTACNGLGSGAHLLTVNSALGSSKLLAFASSLYHLSGSFAYIGCFQQPFATQRGRDWYWVDNTDNSNLNCGTGAGAEGCNLWNTGEPSDGGSSTESHAEDYCAVNSAFFPTATRIVTNRLVDASGSSPFAYLCEVSSCWAVSLGFFCNCDNSVPESTRGAETSCVYLLRQQHARKAAASVECRRREPARAISPE